MALGMTYDEFWEKEADRVKYYREAQKIRNKMRNQEMWIQGAYIYKVMGAYAPIFPAFPARDAKVGEYCEIIPLSKEEAEEMENEKNRKHYEEMLSYTRGWATNVNSTKGGDDNG